MFLNQKNQVVIHDPADDELYKLKVDIAKGKTEKLDVYMKGSDRFDIAKRPPGEDRSNLPEVPLERQVQMPVSGFRMTVQPLVDLGFRNHFGNATKDRVNAVLEHARTFFTHASLQIKFELEYKPLHNYPSTAFALDIPYLV